MARLTRTELLAKPEVKEAMTEVRRLLRAVLGSGGFAEREESLLTISEETCRGLLEEDLQALADGFGEQVGIDGVIYKRRMSRYAQQFAVSLIAFCLSQFVKYLGLVSRFLRNSLKLSAPTPGVTSTTRHVLA